MMVSPSLLTRGALVTALSDPTYGFNTSYSAAMSNHPGAPAMSIDFTTTTNRNKTFWLGDVDPTDIEESGIFSYPLLTVYSIAGASRNWQKFQRWSGLVSVGARFFISGGPYSSDVLLHDYETWPDCIEDAFLQVVQRPTAALWPATSNYSVLYNGEVSFDRKFPMMGGTNWLQLLTFKLTFECVIS